MTSSGYSRIASLMREEDDARPSSAPRGRWWRRRRCRTPRRPRPCARPRPRRAPSAPRSGCRAFRRRAGSRDRPRRGCRASASPWARRNNKRPGNRSRGMSSLAQLDLLHLQPGAIGLEPPVEHPLGLVLLGRDEADRVFVEALGRELLLDVARRSPTRNRRAFRRPHGPRGCGYLSVIACCSRATGADTAPSAPRTASPTMPMCGFTRQCASSAQSRLTALGADRHRDRPFDRLDDVGEADRRAPAAASAKPPPAPRTLLSRPAAASWPISFCAVGKRHAGLVRPARSRSGARPRSRRAAAVISTTA